MKKSKLMGLFLFLFSQMASAALIELKGDGFTRFNANNAPITFMTSFIIDTSIADADADPIHGLFINAIKGGSVTLNSGQRYNLDFSLPTSVDTNVIATEKNTYAMGALSLYLQFIDALGDKLTLGYYSHTNPGYKDAGFVGAGDTLAGLQNNVWFEGHGEMCISNCNNPLEINTEFHTVAVPEPQPLMLLLLGLVLTISVRRLKLRMN